jgi:hypothetical protein
VSQSDCPAPCSPRATRQHADQISAPRRICIVQAVLSINGSSPCVLCTIDWRMPMSDSSDATVTIVETMAIRPKASGANRRVRIRLLPRRSSKVQP